MSEAYTVKALEWDAGCSPLPEFSAYCVFGTIIVETRGKGWAWSCWDLGRRLEGSECDSEADGKAKAEAWYLSRLMPALVPLAPAAKPAAPDAANVGELREAVNLAADALGEILLAQACGEISYRTSGGRGYEAMLAAESALKTCRTLLATPAPRTDAAAPMGFNLNNCRVCRVQLAPDDFDGICSECDNEPDPDAALPSAADAGVVGRLEQLEAIVAKLPKTADGVPIVFGMTVWFHAGRYGNRRVESDTVEDIEHDEEEGSAINGFKVVSELYSTEQAAALALAAAPDGKKKEMGNA